MEKTSVGYMGADYCSQFVMKRTQKLPSIRAIIEQELARIGLQLTPNALKEVRYDEATSE
jgi:hypothetical protein